MMDRLAIIGIGAVSPLGVGVDSLVQGIAEGRCPLVEVAQFRERVGTHGVAGLVSPWVPSTFDSSGRFARLPRAWQFALVACDEALRSAGLGGPEAGEQAGVFFGTDHGAVGHTEAFLRDLIGKSPRLVSPLSFQNTTLASGAGEVSLRFRIKGPSITVPSGYVSLAGTMMAAAISLANRRIRYAVVVLTEELTGLQFLALSRLGRVSPSGVSRPFESEADGFVPSEGAACLVLARCDDAIAAAHVVGYVYGVGLAHSTIHPKRTDPIGCAIESAMRRALLGPRMQPEDIAFVSAAANSCPLQDRAEALALGRLAEDGPCPLAVTALKAHLGEGHSVSPAFQVIAALDALQRNRLPRTVHSVGIKRLPVPVLSDVPRSIASGRVALVNAQSPGGGTGSIVVGAV
jgi:3-oxoacyl-(acyl-carrier-protein) synthase